MLVIASALVVAAWLWITASGRKIERGDAPRVAAVVREHLEECNARLHMRNLALEGQAHNMRQQLLDKASR